MKLSSAYSTTSRSVKLALGYLKIRLITHLDNPLRLRTTATTTILINQGRSSTPWFSFKTYFQRHNTFVERVSDCQRLSLADEIQSEIDEIEQPSSSRASFSHMMRQSWHLHLWHIITYSHRMSSNKATKLWLLSSTGKKQPIKNCELQGLIRF